jgi:beta-glucosidase
MKTLVKSLLILILCFCWQLLRAQNLPVYKDATQPLDTRVKDLVLRLTLEEKVSLLGYNSKAIPHLGIPAYNW